MDSNNGTKAQDFCAFSREDLLILMNNIAQTAKFNIKKDGYLTPVVLFLVNGNIKVMPMEFSNDTEKDIFKSLIKAMAKKFDVQAIVLINESWFATPANQEDIKSPIRDRADKKEAVVITGTSPSCHFMTMIPFRKDGDAVIFEEQSPFLQDFTDSFTDGIWERAVSAFN